MTVQECINNLDKAFVNLKCSMLEQAAISHDDSYGSFDVSEVSTLAETIIRGLNSKQLNQIERFCMLSTGRYMQFGDFVNNLRLINSMRLHELPGPIVSHTLLTLLFIQGDIDGFDQITLEYI